MTRATTGTGRVFRTGRVATRSTEVSADPRRFESVYRSCQAELYRYVLSIVRDSHAAEDVLQSAVTSAMEALVREERDFELRPWLFRIAHNEAMSRFRRERPTAALDDATMASASLATAVGSVADTAETNQAIDQLWKDLASLPDRQRQALVLRELSGMGHDEIGAVLETSARAVKQTIFEARRGLLEQAEGRAMQCAEVQRTLSDGDGRMRRSRKMRAHLADCAACQAFDVALTTRPERLAVLAPALPLGLSASLLAQLFPGAKGAAIASASTSTAGVSGAASGSAIGGLLAGKIAVVAGVGVLAAGATGVTAVVRDSGGPASTVETSSPAATGGKGTAPAGSANSLGRESAAGSTSRTAATSRAAASPKATSPDATSPEGGRVADQSSSAGNAAARANGRSDTAPGAGVSAAARARTNGASQSSKGRGTNNGRSGAATSGSSRGGASAGGSSKTGGASESSKPTAAENGRSKSPTKPATGSKDGSSSGSGAAAAPAQGAGTDQGSSGSAPASGAAEAGNEDSGRETGRPAK